VIITRTPLRVSFFGGGTDYPDYFGQHGGQTLGVSIDKCSYISIFPLPSIFDYAIKVGYARTETANRLDDIQHPSVRECLRLLGIERGVEIAYMGDLPARTGLGSSSSFTVGLLHALHAFKGELVPTVQLAEEAIHVEHNMIRERVGVQDQYLCAHGGLVHLKIARNGSIRVSPIPLDEDRLEQLQSHLMMVYTGVQRHAHEVLEEQMQRTGEGANAESLTCLSRLVDQGLEILTTGRPLEEFGELLHCGWLAKRRLSTKISSPQIDAWYAQARQAGAIGGKLLGAGGGGFLLLFVAPEKRASVRRALQPLKEVEFRFEFNGTSLLYYNPTMQTATQHAHTRFGSPPHAHMFRSGRRAST
jgi:D-glycero-alpha-D-manno-heptose-7-phosphate kinase